MVANEFVNRRGESSSQIVSKEIFDSVTPIPFGGATSQAYRVRIGGKEYFMKRLRPELKNDWRYRSAYQKEYEVGRSISNDYIVRYKAIDEDAEGLYILMELVNGRTLEEKLAAEPEYFARGRNFEKLFIQLLRGLKVLHEAHVAYLDLKPENVMLTQVNSDVKIVDLGFCFADAYSHTAGTTQTFAAPELQKGEVKMVDERTDIYAVGQLMRYVRDIACVDISSHMQHVIEKCTAPAMQERYADVDEVIKAVSQKRRWIRRIGMAIAVLLVVSIGLVMITKTEHYAINKQRIGWWLRMPQHDIVYAHNKYRILSEDSLTCMVVGGRRFENIYINDNVPYRGKVYRTVSVADDAFAGRRIRSVHIPDGVRDIGARAFCHCEHIVSLHLPASVETVGDRCFEALKGMRSLLLSGGVKVIPPKAFVANELLERLVIPEGVEELGLDAFAICTSLKEVLLPSTLIKMDRGVFWRCRNLKEVRIPASVKEIGEFAFYDCDSLTDVYNCSPIPQMVPPIYNGRNITLHVPRGSEELYRKAENWHCANVVAIED